MIMPRRQEDALDEPELFPEPAIAIEPEKLAPKKSEARKSDKAPNAYRTISEVALELSMPQHVLRFWETKFSQLKPLKRGGGRRYYRSEDVTLLREIHALLYGQGYTIKGAQKVLKDGRSAKPAQKTIDKMMAAAPKKVAAQDQEVIREMLEELKALRALV